MKIKRFNESLELYSESVVEMIIADHNILMNKVYEYFMYKLPDIDLDLEADEISINDLIYSRKNHEFVINYSTNYDFENSYYVDNTDEFIAFLNNQDLVKNSNKYNI